MHPKNDRNFRKSDVCEHLAEFGRPCRGLSPGKGFALKEKDHTWLVETTSNTLLDTAQGKWVLTSDIQVRFRNAVAKQFPHAEAKMVSILVRG